RLRRARGVSETGEHPGSMAVGGRPGFGRLNPFAEAVEQRQAQRLLELLDLVGDGGLAQLEPPRRQAEALQVGDGLERPELPERDRTVEIELSWGVGHAAYDMPYGSAQTQVALPRPAHHAKPRRGGGAAARAGFSSRAEDQPVPQAPVPGAARRHGSRKQAPR